MIASIVDSTYPRTHVVTESPLPRRIPGAHLQIAAAPSGVPWFEPDDGPARDQDWPTDDLDAPAYQRFLRQHGIPAGPETDALFTRVLAGSRGFTSDPKPRNTSNDDAACINDAPTDPQN
jgi:hypothetical protein